MLPVDISELIRAFRRIEMDSRLLKLAPFATIRLRSGFLLGGKQKNLTIRG
ncbi:hypothetical protein HAT2_00258 [Candidatus Similichlamydia laticola]|uniref:Uncharacterized protein n=1 Tax=Candidatus Similichlamydia laticola TaxID=2170265 RepID=A0A369KFG5_9BACT|nr:hypothetical protein HAT2_00258 [Candidatus Similichlamydia laticola]